MLEERINEWRAYVRRRQAIDATDVDELEDHLRSQVEALTEAGLDEDEAFLVAVKRLGDLDSLSREFAREYSERLWKQLVVSPDTDAGSPAVPREARVAIGLAVAAGAARNVLVVASDCRMGAPRGALESKLGDGAVAFLVSDSAVIARFEAGARDEEGGEGP